VSRTKFSQLGQFSQLVRFCELTKLTKLSKLTKPVVLLLLLADSCHAACDLNKDGSANISDVQMSVSQAIGISVCTTGDMDGNGQCNIVDVQRVVNAALGGACISAAPSGDCGAGNGNPICDATNTGIAGKGVTTASLTPMAAGNTTANGQLIYRKVINGNVCVVHNNVIIRESQINGGIFVGRRNPCSGSGDVNVTGTLIEDTTINPNGGLEGVNDINGINSVYQRNDICCTQNFFTIWTGTNAKLLSNFGHDESSDSAGQHFDGIEAYGWLNGLTIRNNTIYQTQSGGATAPLNITPSGTPTGTLLAEYNLFRSANSAYVILGDDSQGGAIVDAVFNNNRLWRVAGGGYFGTRNTTGNSHYNGTGNVDHLTGAAVPVPAPH
jgi:hypothetical protein